MNRRTFLRSLILGSLTAPLVTRQVQDGEWKTRVWSVQPKPERITFGGHDVVWDNQRDPRFTHVFYPPLDGPVVSTVDIGGRRYMFTERSIYDAGPL